MDRELKDYLDRQSDYLERQFAEVRAFQEETRRRFDEAREFRKETGRELAEIRDDVRRTRVLVEKLDDKVDLVAEGVESSTQVMRRLHEERGREQREHKAVIEAAHRHLERRVSEHDVEIGALGSRVRQLGT